MGLFSPKEYAGSLEWEELDNHGAGAPQYLARTKVFGGWLVSCIVNGSIGGSGLTFIPDPEHKWNPRIDEEAEKRRVYLEDYEKRHKKN